MPTYAFTCKLCGDSFEHWQSIHADRLLYHDGCGGDLALLLGPVRTMGVGKHGQKTKEVEAREARWHKDMPAYKRFRERGYQPPQIDGCDKLEATAQSTLEINSGGRLKVNESEARAKKEMAEDIMAGRA